MAESRGELKLDILCIEVKFVTAMFRISAVVLCADTPEEFLIFRFFGLNLNLDGPGLNSNFADRLRPGSG